MAGLGHLPGRTAVLDGETYLHFSGTSYLGLADNADFQQLLQEGIAKYSGHYGGSRLGGWLPEVFAEAEAWLAEFTGAPAALLVSSGSLAGQLAVRAARGQFFAGPGLHPAVWREGPGFLGGFAAWGQHLAETLPTIEGPAVLATNAIDPLGVQAYDFSLFETLPLPEAGATLIVDDSHGLGVLGSTGGGSYAGLPQREGLNVVVVGATGKALSVSGGMVLGKQSWMEQIWQQPFFGGASPPPPAFLYAMMRSTAIYTTALQRLRRNIAYLSKQLPASLPIRSLPGYPVFAVDDPAIGPWLRERKVLISQLAYPTPDSDLLTRIVVNGAHGEGDLEGLVGLLRRFFQ